ncbi:hypothetical protein [Vibrio sp. D431a]|uniref:hypothetical protein n=1 Tax=Vibrio sp. D431a TaxID=2837388 RepID=UPI002554C136|nr:hypothetical protein [Vibrio sp. D431a]MDK9789929.1 hypothetical protein [Vibrio sp. D431a]
MKTISIALSELSEHISKNLYENKPKDIEPLLYSELIGALNTAPAVLVDKVGADFVEKVTAVIENYEYFVKHSHQVAELKEPDFTSDHELGETRKILQLSVKEAGFDNAIKVIESSNTFADSMRSAVNSVQEKPVKSVPSSKPSTLKM